MARKRGKKMNNKNPRGQLRPRDGRGKGVGMPNGRRGGRNTGNCKYGGPGYGRGGGRGRGRGRQG